MLIIDAHLDLAWNALQWNRDLQHSVYTIRSRESTLTGAGRGQGTVALPEMRAGRVALCFATLLARSTGRALQNLDYSSPLQAYAVAQGQLAYYRSLEKAREIRLITNRTELDDHMASWEGWETDPLLLSRFGSRDQHGERGPDPSPGDLPAWKEAGVRMIGPAHYGPGRYAGGTSTELGLRPWAGIFCGRWSSLVSFWI